jgi:predicted Zn-dependent peptidase
MVTKYIQHNGLRVILEPVDSAASISAGLWINRGSRHERAEEYGYAHFVEHMLFKGTEKYSARELARIVDRVGGQHNAATNREYTCYYINVISDHIELALEILSDMYYHPLFDKDELEKEKNVILEEIMMYEDTPDELVHDLFIESMMKGHPLSHSILGTTTTIRDATSESLRNFYSANYCNDNAIFVLSGKFDEQAVKDLIKKYFEKENSGAASASLVETVSPGRIARNHAERDLEQMHFCMGAEGLKRNDPDRWSLYILSTILGGSMSSRLFQKVREERGSAIQSTPFIPASATMASLEFTAPRPTATSGPPLI